MQLKADKEIHDNFDAKKKIEEAAHSLKLMSYEISRCVTSGLEHFQKLQVNTTKDINDYKETKLYASG